MNRTIQRDWRVNGVLTDVTSMKLSDPTGTFGVKRDDTDAVVVADDTEMVRISEGIYRYTFEEPEEGLTYTAFVEVEYEESTHYIEHDIDESTDEPVGDYADVLKYIRSLTFDTDTMRYRHSDAILKSYIKVVVPSLSFTVSFDSVNEVFDKELTETEMLEISASAALIIISGMPTEFSYKTAIQSGRRKYNTRNLLNRIERILQNITGGSVIVSSSDEVYKITNDATLYTDLIDASQI